MDYQDKNVVETENYINQEQIKGQINKDLPLEEDSKRKTNRFMEHNSLISEITVKFSSLAENFSNTRDDAKESKLIKSVPFNELDEKLKKILIAEFLEDKKEKYFD
ncbi:MAG: hypothetical protein GF383_09750 [Candidatus Lokiarchaeota archaeon]|nr:hypothetical protein [Candidatus Lokiarchaeota archaeon]MBD3340807.1 hypothetical protein [Candidatus Lokiarchaeota archaeon]